MARISHGKIRIKIEFNNNIWWPDRLVKLLQVLPGIRRVELDHVYSPRDIEVTNDEV